ncbi:MAG: carboxypeptidase-like regulatory domain-containing protein, partial [Acidobacteriota bacterium]
MTKWFERVVLFVVLALGLAVAPAAAQITTGTVAGTVKDSQGGVVPGATIVLVSEGRGTRSAPVVTNAQGDYVLANVTADTYTVEVAMEGFKTINRTGIKVSGGDRVAVPALTLEVGGASETVNVKAEAALVQAQSGERSFAVSTEQVENLPIQHSNFTSLTSLTPGVIQGGASAGGTRIGGVGQNNIMMDGISAM